MSDSALDLLAAVGQLPQGAPRAALVADALDALGYRDQCVDAGLLPHLPGDRIFGKAFTVQAELIDYLPDPPYVGLLESLDSIGPGQVYVLATAGGRAKAAAWGELCATASLAKGATGALIDGPLRDSELLADLGFPVFARGRLPSDCHGRLDITSINQPVTIGSVLVNPGDLVVGDADGIVVIPAQVADEALAAAHVKGERESLFRDAVAEGVRASDAFRRFGVL